MKSKTFLLYVNKGKPVISEVAAIRQSGTETVRCPVI